MKSRSPIKVVSYLLLAAMASSGCTSATVIRTTDPHAKIFVDSEYKGTGSVTHADQKVIGSATHVKIERTGCQSESFIFSRNEEFDAGACVGGVFLLVPFLWVMKYKPEHVYDYRCRTIQSSGLPQYEPAH
jgi:hypothetical protein